MKSVQIKFFRVFRLRKSWQVWRRSVRSRKSREARTRLSAYLTLLQEPFYSCLANVSELCYRLSHMGLLKVRTVLPAVRIFTFL